MEKNISTNKIRIFRTIVILAFAVCLLLMRAYEPHFLALSDGVATLDMRFHYNSVEAYKLFDTLGIQGRLLYITILLIDFIFIASFALVQNFILKFVMGKVLLETRWRRMLAISYLRGISDAIENISLLILINKFPLKIPELVAFSSFFTTLKFIFLVLWLILIPVLFVVRINKRKELSYE